MKLAKFYTTSSVLSIAKLRCIILNQMGFVNDKLGPSKTR